jgi:cytochrome c2
MFDTMTFTKTLGALCGSLLVFLLGSWAAESLYHTGGGHGEEDQAYVIDTGEEEVAEAPKSEGPSFAELYASAEPSKGERVFNQCKACHKLEEGVNSVGPYLHAVVGRDIGSANGYNYSETLAGLEGAWTPEKLNTFLENPAGYAPGTKMAFAGLRGAEDRANVIAYLSTQGGTFDPAAVQAPAAAPEQDASAPAGDAPAQPASDHAAAPAAEESAPQAAENAPQSAASADQAAAAPPAAETPAAAASTTQLAGDPEAGKKAFRVCMACHKVEEGKNGVGPSLHNVVGRDIGSAPGFAYSDAMKSQDGVWTPEKLEVFLANPREAVPGNKMPFAGVSDAEKRQDIIAYLASIGN